MKNKLLIIILSFTVAFSFAQTAKPFLETKFTNIKGEIFENKKQIKNPRLFELNIAQLKQSLVNSPKRFAKNTKSSTIVSFPDVNGQFENFQVFEYSNMDSELAARYPEIKSYIGQGVDNPTSTIYFSISPLGLQSMIIKADQSAVFIEPYTKDLNYYTVYRKSDKVASLNKFECKVIDNAKADLNNNNFARPNADDGNLRNFRLALSVTGEYTAYFGGTKALALAAMNNSMTRVNAVFEKDFGVHMNLIANNDLIIYTNASTDPYSPSTSMSKWNAELQNNLTSVIGEANYDIGHLFGATGGGGNAGCIGCVCKDGSKGSGITSPADGIPQGDNFDIDYVAHEMGHQFGGNHTFTFSNEGTIAQVEPGSGTTIMGYAGITGATDVQAHSDAFFHAVSIQQVTNYVKSTTCQTTVVTGNAIPTVNAGLDYTIPKGTPFVLTGLATDSNNDVLTYDWEQMDKGTSSTTYPSVSATTGPAFKSFITSTSPSRYFPQMSTVLTGATSWKWEAVPNVARTMNFRLTVRDNHLGGSANNSDDVVVTVNATAGPFSVSSPNTAVSYVGGSSQTVTWNVAGTTANGVNAANVDILLSTDGGSTFPITLIASTPNDGSQVVIIPNIAGTKNRIMIKGSNHIFFDVSNVNFTITNSTTDTVAPSAPTNLVATGTTETTTNLSWTASTDNVAVTGYDVYKGTVLIGSTVSTSYNVTGLIASTTYTFSVKAKDAVGNTSADSNLISVTTLAAIVDTIAPSAPSNLLASGTTQTTTNLSWTSSTDNVGVVAYEVYQGNTLIGTVVSTSFGVTGLTASTNYSFTVIAKDAVGNASSSSNIVNITTLAVVISNYCSSQGSNATNERIGKVAIGSINNSSTSTAGYENFTSIATNTTRGNVYTITITPTWGNVKYKEGYAVWIDYNADGDFADSGELVWSKVASKTSPVSGTFTVLATAKIGSTRMRVSMKYNGIPTSCESFSFGQVEDYTVNIVSTVKDSENTSVLALSIYPNPVRGNDLNISSINKGAYRIINLLGQEVAKGNFENNVISVSQLNSGTYLLEITSENQSAIKRFIKQ